MGKDAYTNIRRFKMLFKPPVSKGRMRGRLRKYVMEVKILIETIDKVYSFQYSKGLEIPSKYILGISKAVYNALVNYFSVVQMQFPGQKSIKLILQLSK